MYIELSVFAILSAFLLFTFISAGIIRFGLLPSYSSYSAKWGKAVPINNLNIWSVVTIVAAFLLCPPLLQLGVGSVWQFLGFLVPVYLIVVALTPDWETSRTQRIVHSLFALLCATGGILWLVLIVNAWKLLAGVLVFILTLALLTGTMKSSVVFWGEMILFISVYLVVLLAIL